MSAPAAPDDKTPRLRAEVNVTRDPAGEPAVVIRAGVGAQVQTGFQLPPEAALRFGQQVVEQAQRAMQMLVVVGDAGNGQ